MSYIYFNVTNTTTGNMQQNGRKTNDQLTNIVSQSRIITDLVSGTTVPGTPFQITGGPLYGIGQMGFQYIQLVKTYQKNSSLNSLFLPDDFVRLTFLGGTTLSTDSIIYAFANSTSQTFAELTFNMAIANTNSQITGDYFDIQLPDPTAYPNIYLVLCLINGAWTTRTIVSGNQCRIEIGANGTETYCINPSQSLQDVGLKHFILVSGYNSIFGINSNIAIGIEDEPIASSNLDYANIKIAISSRMINDSLINDTGLLDPICFVKGTKILCLVSNSEVYIPIEDLTTNHYIKTYDHGYKKIIFIKQFSLINTTRQPIKKRDKINKIYKLAKEDYEELFEDLYINGGHSILVDTLSEEEDIINLKLFGKYKKIGDKIRLFTYINEKAIPINDDFRYEMYHISTGEEEGIYANGILTESYNLENNIKMLNF
jgi:hypothetical protein